MKWTTECEVNVQKEEKEKEKKKRRDSGSMNEAVIERERLKIKWVNARRQSIQCIENESADFNCIQCVRGRFMKRAVHSKIRSAIQKMIWEKKCSVRCLCVCARMMMRKRRWAEILMLFAFYTFRTELLIRIVSTSLASCSIDYIFAVKSLSLINSKCF